MIYTLFKNKIFNIYTTVEIILKRSSFSLQNIFSTISDFRLKSTKRVLFDTEKEAVYIGHVRFEAALLSKSFQTDLTHELWGYSTFVSRVSQ